MTAKSKIFRGEIVLVDVDPLVRRAAKSPDVRPSSCVRGVRAAGRAERCECGYMTSRDTVARSLAHWSEAGRVGMESFYALAIEDYRQMVAALDWAGILLSQANGSRVRVLDVACGSGKFPAELIRTGIGGALGDVRVDVELLDPSTFSIAEARSVLKPPFTVTGEHPVRLQELGIEHGGFDAAWATHALYAIPPDELGNAVNRMVTALRPGGFGAVVQARTDSHYLRFATAFGKSFAPAGSRFTSAEDVVAALSAAGVTPSVVPLDYSVACDDDAVVEAFLQRCVFDDSISLEAMVSQGPVAAYLASCRTPHGWRFDQHVDILTWENPV